MDNVKLNLGAIRANMNLSRSEMASLLGMTTDRYTRLENGESRMFATELYRLHEVSKVPYENIALPD